MIKTREHPCVPIALLELIRPFWSSVEALCDGVGNDDSSAAAATATGFNVPALLDIPTSAIN